MTTQEIAIAAIEEASHEDDPVDIAVTYRIALERIAKGGWIPVEEMKETDIADLQRKAWRYDFLMSEIRKWENSDRMRMLRELYADDYALEQGEEVQDE